MTPPGTAATAPSHSATSASDEAAHLASLLTRQRDLYRELGGLSARQQQLIEASQTEQLLGLLTQRQLLIDQLTKCNQEVAPLRSRMGDIAAAASAGLRDTIRDRVDEVQGLLEEIIGRDEADRAKLEASRARVGNEIKRVNATPAAVNAYRAQANAAPRSTPRFTDAQG